MDRQEFSYRFDVLYNNIASNASPGINEYEKSVFLTKAQDEIVKGYFNPAGNKYRQGFEETEKRKMDFSTILVVRPYLQDCTEQYSRKGFTPFHKNGKLYEWPEDLLFVADETVTTTEGDTLSVIPIDNVSYLRLMSKPFQYPPRSQCWRMVHTLSDSNDIQATPESKKKRFITEIVTSLQLSTYILRYIKKPYPIILPFVDDSNNSPVNRSLGVTIDGYDFYDLQHMAACELDEYLHEEVLQRAVELAKASMGDQQEFMLNVESGKRSE